MCILIYCNSVVELEVILNALKSGVVVPVYNGGGKDPLRVNSYRGVTFWSFLFWRGCRCFSYSQILTSLLTKKKVSCADAIFAAQEVIARYMKNGTQVYMCLYDLQKAFDSVEYPVLLDRLFEVGMNGKMWHLLKSWYSGACKNFYSRNYANYPRLSSRRSKKGNSHVLINIELILHTWLSESEQDPTQFNYFARDDYITVIT